MHLSINISEGRFLIMAPMIDMQERIENNVAAFYDKLAPDYDTMTRFGKRFVHEKPFFRLLVDRYNIKTALDAGCGTGFHSLLLSQLGVTVTAVDVSQIMLERLALHAKQMGETIEAVKSSFQDLPKNIQKKFDAIFSLGNSLTHLPTQEDLLQALSNFSSLLKPRGVIFLQNLNYDRIVAQHERVQSVKEEDGVTFVRFYDYENDRIRFNILKLKRQANGIEPELNSIEIRPILKDDLFALLEQAGFVDVKPFGAISMEEYHPEASQNLVVLAAKAA
jgi:2-polyprenyl-3-methyl-5-hydroxy-6-metoxy-1,4-benzoquinol methylase